MIVSFVLWEEAADEDGVNFKVVEALVVTLAGLNAEVTPVGSPEIEKVTGPVKPSAGASVMVSLTGTDGNVTVTLVDSGFSVKRPAPAAPT